MNSNFQTEENQAQVERVNSLQSNESIILKKKYSKSYLNIVEDKQSMMSSHKQSISMPVDIRNLSKKPTEDRLNIDLQKIQDQESTQDKSGVVNDNFKK